MPRSRSEHPHRVQRGELAAVLVGLDAGIVGHLTALKAGPEGTAEWRVVDEVWKPRCPDETLGVIEGAQSSARMSSVRMTTMSGGFVASEGAIPP